MTDFLGKLSQIGESPRPGIVKLSNQESDLIYFKRKDK